MNLNISMRTSDPWQRGKGFAERAYLVIDKCVGGQRPVDPSTGRDTDIEIIIIPPPDL